MTSAGHIFFVGADLTQRDAVCATLGDVGFQVTTSQSEAESLAAMKPLPDLIVIASEMTDVTSAELTQHLKADARFNRIPILHLKDHAVTAHPESGASEASLPANATPKHLIDVVRKMIKHRSPRRNERLMEDRYRQVVENVQDFSIFTTDAGRFIQSWNIGAERLTGWSEDDVIGKSAAIIYTEEDRAAGIFEREFSTAARDGRSPDERWHKRKDKTRYFANGVITAIFDEDQNLIGFSKVMQDVTARRLAEQQLEDSRRLAQELQASAEKSQRAAEEARQNAEAAQLIAEQANRLKDEFLATLSHELRTPLNAIVGWAQLLRSPDVTPEDIADGVETIERNAKLQSQLIEDLLDISRIISGKLRLDMQAINLAAAVNAAIGSMQPAAEAKGISLNAQVADKSISVFGDASRVQQVVWNLLSNAVKFSGKGGSVSVTVRQERSNAVVSVEDAGIGIESQFLPHVFDRFRQADSTSRRFQSGLGLGLSIVKQLVELHGGTVGVSSDGENKGSTFVVTFPVHAIRETRAKAEPPNVGETVRRATRRTLDGVTILVVEDDPDSRTVLVRILQERGATVLVAGGADAAIAAMETQFARSKTIDAIISDIGMPGENGYDLIKRIRTRDPENGGRVPAIALTAFARQEDRDKALAAGFQLHLSKPTDADELVAAVARLTGRVGVDS